MEYIVTKDYEEMSKEAAKLLIRKIKENPNIVLGLATGSTPIRTYELLVEAYKNGEIDFSNVTTFNLDEYIGLPKGHDQSYDYFMHEKLFNHINIKEENINFPCVNEDGQVERLDYEKKIKEAGGIDIQILGVGSNGHIAFNEPDEELNLNTSIVKLTESTIEDNSRFFEKEEDVPKTAISMGIGSIFMASELLVLANGKNKKEAIDKVLNSDKITTQWPITLVNLHHNVTLIIDEEVIA